MCQGQKSITKIAGTEAEDLCPNKSNQLYKQSWNKIALCIPIHHAMRKPQSKMTQEDILLQMLERIELLSGQ